MTSRIWAAVLCCAAVATTAGLAPASAAAFGTVNGLGQQGEHERITRIALGCRAGEPTDGSGFERASLENLAGNSSSAFPPRSGSFGAVGAADDLPLRLGWGGPYYWHCDDADYLELPYPYPQTRAQATQKLMACRSWARDMLLFGRPERLQEKPTGIHRIIPRTWPVTGAVGQARHLLNADGRVDVRDPGMAGSRNCVFDGTINRPKCNVWEPFGYVLHAAEDFYSHSNWADQANPHNRHIELVDPPGLAHRDLPAFWDLRDPSATLPDPRLTTGCYPADECQGRVLHDELSKDKELINVTTGVVTDPGTPRGRVLTNAQRAVNGAIGEAKRQWAILRWELVKHYGAEQGGKMICALTSDTADASVQRREPGRRYVREDPAVLHDDRERPKPQ